MYNQNMGKTTNLLNKLEIWFFYGFLITFTLSIRKILFFYLIKNQFNEYTGVYLYLSDLFLLLILISGGLSILYNKIFNKSRSRSNLTAYLKQKIVLIPLSLVAFSFISVFWSASWQVATFRSLKLLEFYLLYSWLIFQMFHVEHEDDKKCSTWNIIKNSIRIIIFTGVIQSFFAICQFIAQKSIGLIWLRESILSADISGVAKIVFNGEKYIRAYGLFPHPNILGGFLVLSIVLTFAYFKPLNFLRNLKNGKNERRMFHVEHEDGKKSSTWNIGLYYIFLIIQFIALVLTFSKSAWIGLMIAIFYLLFRNKAFLEKCFTWNILRNKKETLNDKKLIYENMNVPRGTFWHKSNRKMFHVEHWRYFALIVGIVFLTIVILKPNWYSLVGKSFEDRMFYLDVSRGTFWENPILGVGMGQYVYHLINIPNIQDWQFQPVHNIFLLILNELGIVGLSLFFWFVWRVIKNASSIRCSTWNILWDKRDVFKAIFLSFLFIMLVDHYFWDIQQGQGMLWFILAILAGGNLWTRNKFNSYPQAQGKQY